MAIDWVAATERDIDTTRDSLAGSKRMILATLVAMASIGAFTIGVVEDKELTFSDLPSIAPWWVGIQMLSLSAGALYAVYMRSRLPLIREITKKGNWPLLTPEDLIKASTYLLMGVSLAVAAWDRGDAWITLLFVPSALIFFDSASLIFSEERMREIARTGFGAAPRIRNLVKRAKQDMNQYTKSMIITGLLYFVVGLLYIALSWNEARWSTALPLSLAAAAFLALARRNFNEYGLSVSLEERFVALEALRVDLMTQDLSEETARTRYRALNGVTNGEK